MTNLNLSVLLWLGPSCHAQQSLKAVNSWGFGENQAKDWELTVRGSPGFRLTGPPTRRCASALGSRSVWVARSTAPPPSKTASSTLLSQSTRMAALPSPPAFQDRSSSPAAVAVPLHHDRSKHKPILQRLWRCWFSSEQNSRQMQPLAHEWVEKIWNLPLECEHDIQRLPSNTLQRR